MDFGGGFLINDNLADPGTGGEAFASFLQGISDGGSITSVNPNIIYNRQIYRSMLLTISKSLRVSP